MNIYRIVGIGLSVFCLINYSVSFAREVAAYCTSTIYSDNSFTQIADNFSIYDEVYLRVHCKALPKGTHKITTQWMDENGRLQSERGQNFEIGFPRGHSASFKFKQMPQGSIKRITSGDDFEDHQYGRWSVLTFINNEEIGLNHFTINN